MGFNFRINFCLLWAMIEQRRSDAIAVQTQEHDPVLISTAHRPRRLGFGNCSSIEIGLGLGGAFVEEVSEKLVGLFALAAGGFLEAVEHALIFQPFWPARALENFAHDDQRAQAALGLVVSRRHPLVTQKGEHVLLFGSVQSLAEVLGRFIAQGFAAESRQLTAQGPFLSSGGFGAPAAFGELAVGLAGATDKFLDFCAEAAGRW